MLVIWGKSSKRWTFQSVGSSHLRLITIPFMSSSRQSWLMSLKGECLLCSGLADSNKSLRALCGEALDVEWPCHGLTSLHDKKAMPKTALCYELINLKQINNLASVISAAPMAFFFLPLFCPLCVSGYIIYTLICLFIPATYSLCLYSFLALVCFATSFYLCWFSMMWCSNIHILHYWLSNSVHKSCHVSYLPFWLISLEMANLK